MFIAPEVEEAAMTQLKATNAMVVQRTIKWNWIGERKSSIEFTAAIHCEITQSLVPIPIRGIQRVRIKQGISFDLANKIPKLFRLSRDELSMWRPIQFNCCIMYQNNNHY